MTKLSFQCLIFVLLFANFSQFDPFLLFFLPFKRAWQLRGVQEEEITRIFQSFASFNNKLENLPKHENSLNKVDKKKENNVEFKQTNKQKVNNN